MEQQQHCKNHEEFLVAVTQLTSDVKSMQNLFKGAMSVMVTIALFTAGLVATFSYEAGNLYAQVRVNTTEIVNHKEINHNGR